MISKVLFLVGGLGSNEFLAKSLKSRIKLGIVVKRDILRDRAREVFKLYAQYGGERY